MKGMERRPHVQGDAAAIDVELTDEVLTDGAGLTVLRALWDKLEIGAYLDRELAEVGGRYRPSLHAEQWIALLAYGGGCMDHLPLLESRGVRALLGWERVVHPTSFGRFVRRVGRAGAKACDEVLRKVVQARWKAVGGVPRVVQLTLDSTVNVRYGVKQAGAEVGYNPKKHGRTSHHPLLAFLDTGDCLGVQWRPGKAHTAAGAEEWLEELVAWLREQGVRRIVVRLDKGFFRAKMIEKLTELGVDFVVKMTEHRTLQCFKGRFEKTDEAGVEVSRGERWGVRMLGVRWMKRGADGELPLGNVEVRYQATILTNLDIDPMTAWELYNRGALVEQRMEELAQLGVGRTAVDDLGGNHLLWSLGVLAYQLLHCARTLAVRTHEQVKTIRLLVLRTPGKLVRHAGRLTLKLTRHDAMAKRLLHALQRLRLTATRPVTAM
jgi:hypothetical protein